MARIPVTTIGCLMCVGIAATGTTQTLTFAKDDYASDIGARAIVAADFNRDGWLDVAHANTVGNSVVILMNDGGGRLARAVEVPVGLGPFDLATADFNRDGIPDLAVANADGNSISILLGRGDGSFARADIAAPSQNPRGITAADVNNDGRADVIYTGFATGTVQVLIGDGAGGFTRGATYIAAGSQPQGIASGDFDRDGRLDLAIACVNSTALRILYGSAGGSFTARTVAGHANLNVLAAGDLNGDGWLDIAAASTGGSDVAVYLGGASGLVFARAYVVGSSPRGITLADLNDDGRLDVITANRSSSTVSVLEGDRTHPGAFLAHRDFASSSGSRAVAVGDFDVDGRLDVVTGNEYTAAVSVLSNATAFEKAAFSFHTLTLPSGTPLASADTADSRFALVPQIAAADFNRDGKIDFAVPAGTASDSSAVAILLRDGPTVVLSGPAPLTHFLVGDFNADGNPDVLYYSLEPGCCTASTRFVTFLGDGRGNFTPSPMTIEPQPLEWCGAGDLNRNRRPDLVCDHVVLRANGDGTFGRGVAFAGPGGGATFPGPFFADVDRDGKLDAITTNGVFLGDGAGNLTPDPRGSGIQSYPLAVGDLNHDGWVDVVTSDSPDGIFVFFGGPGGFSQQQYRTLEDFASFAIADMNADGWPDIVQNDSVGGENSGVVEFLLGHADGTFTSDAFVTPSGPIVAADVNGDGLPDLASYDSHAIHVLISERNEINHAPVVTDYSVTSGTQCTRLDARASDPDQQYFVVEWFNTSGELVAGGAGDHAAATICVGAPGTYRFTRTATDSHGAKASGSVTLTYTGALREIVLYAAADNVQMSGNWSRVADPTAAGGFRAYDRNLGAPKVRQPSATPANTITIPFVADQNLTYKLWLRLKADANSWANDSVWVQFSSPAAAPYTTGTTAGLSVSLEECVGCGVSGWGWEDDGFGAVNKNGALLQFDAGPQTIVIQTREDGVSIDQIVLSAEQYLTTRPGTAKNDQTILPPRN